MKSVTSQGGQVRAVTMQQEEIFSKEFYRRIGRKGGLSCLHKYGKEFFAKISSRRKGGIAVLKKYGKEYFRELGRKSGQLRLRSKGKEFFTSISKLGVKALRKKYGVDVFSLLGKRGAASLLQKVSKSELTKNLVRRSLQSSKKYYYRGLKFRSKLEVRIAALLDELQIPFEYEAPIGDYYPDFTFGSTIIEVCGVMNKGYPERIAKKVKLWKELGFRVIIFATYSLVDSLQRLLPDVKIVTTLDCLRILLHGGRGVPLSG